MGKIKTIFLAIIIIVIIALIVFIIIKTNKTNNPSLKNTEISKEIYGFSAVIKKINNNTLTLEASILLADTSKEPITATIKALTDDQTKITKLTFPAAVEDKTKPIYPEEITLQLSELRVGDKINASSTINISEKLKNGEVFLLNSIWVIE